MSPGNYQIIAVTTPIANIIYTIHEFSVIPTASQSVKDARFAVDVNLSET